MPITMRTRLRALARRIRSLRLPTGLVVALVGTVVSAWFIPALTRQWQDQQRARDLKAAIVTRIGRDTTEALVVSSFIANGRFEPVRRPHRAFRIPMEVFHELDLGWDRNRREIEAQLEAYFPDTQIVTSWREYSQLVRDTYWLITERVFRRDWTVNTLQEVIPRKHCNIESLRKPFYKPPASDDGKTARSSAAGARRSAERPRPGPTSETTPARRRTGRPCRKEQLKNPRSKYFFVASELLKAKSNVTDDILRADPEGLSTDASDFFQDLLPFV